MQRRSKRTDLQLALVPASPLRRADPRTKLVLSLIASLAVMLPLDRLLFALVAYGLLLTWGRLAIIAGQQVWRIKWLLLGLFGIDWLLVSVDHAALVTLRLVLLAGSFTLFFATTTPAELRLALEWLRVPHRYAFSISLAFQSIDLLNQEWRTILEAQQARGAWQPPRGWRQPLTNVRALIALTVPAIVMTTKRAWALTESAYARGFDSPHRRAYHQLIMTPLDWLLLAGALSTCCLFIIWR